MTPSPKTVRLSAGPHESPADGACVMELCSMLAGERFSDRPESVCPTIAAFLRGYNDQLGDGLRQDLYQVAAEVLETRVHTVVERARADRCLALARRLDAGPKLLRELRLRFPYDSWNANSELAGAYTAQAVRRRPALHAAVLEFVRELVALGRPSIPAQMAPGRQCPTAVAG
ncbi:MAG TPA: hypothetical protein VD931_05435 [Baekduia sp.]|nr:hypothetical protein [Baekduia sp.]